MSAVATTVEVDRQSLVDLLVEIETVTHIFGVLAAPDSPFLIDLTTKAERLYTTAFGSIEWSEDPEPWAPIGLFGEIQARGEQAAREFMRPEGGASPAKSS